MLSPDRIEILCEQSKTRFEAARASIREKGSALVAFSGGADSALVLKLAVEELGERAVALTAISASVAPGLVLLTSALTWMSPVTAVRACSSLKVVFVTLASVEARPSYPNSMRFLTNGVS